MTPWSERIRGQLDEVVDAGRWRAPRAFDANGPRGVLDGDGVVSFASNDYLGLSSHPAVVQAAHDALDRWGAGAGASRLITGSRPVHSALERALATWKGTAAAICFPTGFAANLGVLSVLGGPGVRVLSDELNHASIIDGCRLARAESVVYRHADMAHLGELLAASAGAPTVVVTDSVFSMDGDVAPLDDIVTLCRQHGACLVLDEAHAVLGPELPPGSGGSDDLLIVRVGTLSKTLGALGGFVAGPQNVIDLLVNRARSYIFSTASTPADAAAALAAVQVLCSSEGEALLAQLRRLTAWMAEALIGSPDHPSPIIPVVLGSEQRALEASAALLAAGFWVPAIRPPTVPDGSSRLRITLSAAHADEDVAALLDAVSTLGIAPTTAPSLR